MIAHLEFMVVRPRGGQERGLQGKPRAMKTFRNLALRLSRATAILSATLATAAALAPLLAQEDHKHKVSGLDKVIAASSHQAFSGSIQSLDLKRMLLEVNTVEGGDTEIFPVKKGIQVASANGKKLKLKELTPGTDVIIYFEQREDRRTVKQIVVLVPGPNQAKKKSSPPS